MQQRAITLLIFWKLNQDPVKVTDTNKIDKRALWKSMYLIKSCLKETKSWKSEDEYCSQRPWKKIGF